MATTNTENNQEPKKVIHREFTGEVVSAPGQKTIHVLVKTRKMHSKYQKQYWTSKKYAVHDEKNSAAVGDTVTFQECRPFSKTKRWRLV
ncbi:MAG: 30S ribosomal protein S17 [Candidatus Magasanikbacteria bacterium]|jgi:small subunit ribosomal protein S17|nr:30S ribosomal protein S17 [Candidatus Magasanikbacteria bacterium]